jgi:hypothetical protein
VYLLEFLIGLSKGPTELVKLVEHPARLLFPEETGVGLAVFFTVTFPLHVGLKSKLVALCTHAAEGFTVLFD